jgi:hypothetical protein
MDVHPRHTTLITPLLPDEPEEPALFGRVEQALQALPGPWKVGLSHGVEIGWWIVSVYRDDGFECTLFLEGALQQTAAHIRDRMADALQRHAIGLTGSRRDPDPRR